MNLYTVGFCPKEWSHLWPSGRCYSEQELQIGKAPHSNRISLGALEDLVHRVYQYADQIVEQQAQFASDIQQLREAQEFTSQTVAQTGEIVARLANVTLEGFRNVNVKIDALLDSQIRTDDNLRNLIAVVDRYFSEGRNGK